MKKREIVRMDHLKKQGFTHDTYLIATASDRLSSLSISTVIF